MSTTYNDIRAAFDVALHGIDGIPVIEWENRSSSDRTLGDEYISQFWLGGASQAGSLGDTGLDQTIGVYQVNVNTKAGSESIRNVQLCDLIVDTFRPRKLLTYNGVSVRIVTVSRNALVVNGAYATSTIDITYETFTEQRN